MYLLRGAGFSCDWMFTDLGAETFPSLFAGIAPTITGSALSTMIPAARNAMIELHMKTVLQCQTQGSQDEAKNGTWSPIFFRVFQGTCASHSVVNVAVYRGGFNPHNRSGTMAGIAH
jgi:hypothetical protein